MPTRRSSFAAGQTGSWTVQTDSYRPGTFCWLELVTTDQAAARDFYTRLFDWTALEIPVPEGTYTALRLGEDVVAGLFTIDDAMRAQGVLPHWVPFVSVEDVEATATRVAEHGGRVVAGPVDAQRQGRMAVVHDPHGADFALWQPMRFAGSQRRDEPGTAIWHELYTRHERESLAFYSAVLGWEAAREPVPPSERYTCFLSDNTPIGGLQTIHPEWGDMPAHWSVYFAVDDLDHALNIVIELAGHVETEPHEVPSEGRFCLIRDPQGAYFRILERTG